MLRIPSHVSPPAMFFTQHPTLATPLLDVCAAVTYEDFADAAVRFCRVAVPHKGGEVLLSYLDFDADEALVIRSNFPTKRARTHEERIERQRAVKPVESYIHRHVSNVYRGQNHVFPPMRELEKTRLFKEYMLPEGWHDFLGMSFRTGSKIDSTLFVNRAFDQPAFTPKEALIFEESYPYFASALLRVRLLENARAVRTDLESSLLDLPVATLLLNWQLGIEQSNHLAARMCTAWEQGLSRTRALKATPRLEVPADLRATCAELRDAWRSPDTGGIRMVRRTLSHPTQPGLQATITLLRPHALRLSTPTFLIRITEVTVPGESGLGPMTEGMTGLLTRLSPAERELIPSLRRGFSNKEIAGALGKSVPTVKKQLHSILDKLGCPSRARLIAMLT